MANSANPLSKHFRQPALHLLLPSKGRFYPDDGLDLGATGTVPIYPMTVRDELTLKTPDGLMNGESVYDVIRSCCPAIKDPGEMPSIDLDPIFVAMRLASYGKGMDITAKCPHCDESNEYTIDLNNILDNLPRVDYNRAFTFDGLVFKFKPQKYKNMNRIGMVNYEQDRLVQNIVNNQELDEAEKMRLFKISFDKIRQLNLDLVIDSIDSVTTEDGVKVTNREQISEFIESCSRQVYEDIKKAVDGLVDESKIKPLDITCGNDECNKPFKTTLTFDQSNFFG